MTYDIMNTFYDQMQDAVENHTGINFLNIWTIYKNKDTGKYISFETCIPPEHEDSNCRYDTLAEAMIPAVKRVIKKPPKPSLLDKIISFFKIHNPLMETDIVTMDESFLKFLESKKIQENFNKTITKKAQ